MSSDQIFVFAVLGVAIALFLWNRWRYDIVAVAALLALVLGGIVPAEDALSGLGHPAVLTVAAVLIISRAFREAGIVDLLVRLLTPVRGHPVMMITVQTSAVAILSAFMNNVGALALMMPVVLRNAYRAGLAPALVLMPLAFGALLGGLTTLIGTPPNIIIATFRARELGTPYTMFDFAPVGLAVAIAGLAFITLLGWRFIPKDRHGQPDAENLFHVEDYITEARAPEGGTTIGKQVREIEAIADEDIRIAGLIRGKQRMMVPSGFERINAGDVLILEGDPTAIKTVMDQTDLELIAMEDHDTDELRSDQVGVVEAVVNPGSRLEGLTPRTSRLRALFRLNLLAVARHGAPIRHRLSRVRFQAGDVLLLQGERESMAEKLARLGCLPLAERGLRLGQPRRLVMPVLLFGAAILASTFLAVPIHISFIAAVLAMVLAGLIKPAQLYDAVDWPIILLLAGLFPVSAALENTGGTALIAGWIAGLGPALGPVGLLAAVLIVTMIVSDIINNTATALLMAPVALGLAGELGVSPDPFLMAVAIGASCAFLTPIGHQANALIMAPGGYRFGDYWRMGLPLEIVIVIVAVPMILLVWPF